MSDAGPIQPIAEQIPARQAERDRADFAEHARRTMLDSVHDAVILVDVDGRIQTWNGAAETIYGYPESHTIGRHISLLMFPDDVERFDGILDAVIERGAQQVALRHRHRFYHAVDVDLRLQAVENDEGRVIGVLICSQDISKLNDQLRSQAAVRDLEAQLTHVSRLHILGELVAGVAHEINQPLHAIATFAAACKRSLERGTSVDQSTLRAWIEDMSRAARQGGEIVTRLKSFARRGDPQPAPHQINSLVAESLTLIEFEANRQQIEIELDLVEPSPRILIDRILFQQVLVNLLQNAMEATNSAEVTMRKITISSQTQEGKLRLCVRDRGEGLTSGQQIFEPFVTTKPDGLGLGLAISRSIVQSHAGKLWGCNADPGATFYIDLPIHMNSNTDV